MTVHSNGLQEAIIRGRDDVEFWVWFFLGERMHAGQLEWIQNAEAQINVAATANRWGKTHIQKVRHLHRGFYKLGAEWRYVNEQGEVDPDAFRNTRYHTLHTADGWETASMVWEAAVTSIENSDRLRPFIKSMPKSIPPHIIFANGFKWMFRTLGSDGQGIDGKSLYLITIDEAGWITNLEDIITNVARLRTGDVIGMIDLMGTFKSGISRDFFKYATRASIYTKRDINFDFAAWLAAKEAA